VILIVIGVIFLLHNLGVLPMPLRELFATYWPVILIIVGVSLLVRGK
jgi:lia operon protein LiaF